MHLQKLLRMLAAYNSRISPIIIMPISIEYFHLKPSNVFTPPEMSVCLSYLTVQIETKWPLLSLSMLKKTISPFTPPLQS